MSTTVQKKRTPTPFTQTELLETADSPLTIALGSIPVEDWHRTWAACRTMVFTITSMKEVDAQVVVWIKGTSCWGTDNLADRKGDYR